MSLRTELKASLPWILASIVLLAAVLGYLVLTAPEQNLLSRDYGVM